MGLYTQITRDWLARRFARRSDAGVYYAHMPVYGVGHPDCEEGHPVRLARLLRLLGTLERLQFDTLLDVGGAEGYLAHLARTLFSVRAATTDLSVAACQRARELFGLDSAAVDSARLPFADGAFDVVTCSEVIEHVENPVATVLELQRIARKAVIVTTEELHHDRAEIDDYLFRRPGWPHMELNQLHPDDAALLFPGATLTPQCATAPPMDLADPQRLRAWLLATVCEQTVSPATLGIVVLQRRDASPWGPRRSSDAELLERLLATTVAPGARHRDAAAPLSPWFRERLRDPRTMGPLHMGDRELVAVDDRRWPIHDGVPDLVDTDVGEIDRAALQRRLRADSGDRAEALLQLHDRLALAPVPTQSVFEFARRDDRRGFWSNRQLVQRPGAPPFHWHSTGADPWVSTPCLQRRMRAIEIDMRVHNPELAVAQGTGQVFWKGPLDETSDEDRHVDFQVPNDGKVHRHRIVLADHPRFPPIVQWLRLDLVNGPCEVDLLRLEID